MDETLLIVILIVAMLAVTMVLATFAVRAARRLSQGTFSPAVVCVAGAAVAVMIVVVLFMGSWGTTTTESYTEPLPVTGDFKATPLPRTPGMAEGESCWSAEAAVDSRSVANLRQWRYAQFVEWCGNRSQIVGTPANVRSWDSLSPFWDFSRYLDDSETEWEDRYLVSSQAKFRFCAVLEYFCIVEDYPSLGMTAFGNGTFNVEYHGDWTAAEERTHVVRTSLWGALLAALAGFGGASPLAALLIAGGYVATRSKTEGLRSAGVGLMAGGITLAGVFAVAAFLIA